MYQNMSEAWYIHACTVTSRNSSICALLFSHALLMLYLLFLKTFTSNIDNVNNTHEGHAHGSSSSHFLIQAWFLVYFFRQLKFNRWFYFFFFWKIDTFNLRHFSKLQKISNFSINKMSFFVDCGTYLLRKTVDLKIRSKIECEKNTQLY